MIDPSTINALVRGTVNPKPSTPERLASDKRATDDVETDSFEQTALRAAEERPESEPITSRSEAEKVVTASLEQIFDSPGNAFAAQAGLDPEKVLALVG